ncbi:hypothetical protein KI387_014777, partial [Taxus chinensis]
MLRNNTQPVREFGLNTLIKLDEDEASPSHRILTTTDSLYSGSNNPRVCFPCTKFTPFNSNAHANITHHRFLPSCSPHRHPKANCFLLLTFVSEPEETLEGCGRVKEFERHKLQS